MFIIPHTDKEIFIIIRYKDIKNNLYEVSNYGRIRNRKTGRYLKTYFDKDGYKKIHSQLNRGGSIPVTVHRLVAVHFIIPDADHKPLINHKDSVRYHNYYKNLVWSTPQENTNHGIEHGYIDRYHISKYTQRKYKKECIVKICELLERGYCTKDILKKISFPPSERRNYKTLINDIRAKRSWVSISDLYDIKR